jgi:hypothetical protein
MISLPPVVRVYLYTAPCDMRQGFDRLKALAEAGVGVDPRGGHLFVYCSRRRDRLKILYWGVSRAQGNLRSCTEDGRRPPGAGFQELAPNRPELLRPKGVVVNVRGKGIRQGVR